MKPDGICVLADPYIDDYTTEEQRRHAALHLGCEYTHATIEAGAPPKVIEAAIDIIHNDVLGHEFKTSVAKLQLILQDIFPDITIHKTWPGNYSEYGEYIFVCRKK